jgi:hypothetical protein
LPARSRQGRADEPGGPNKSQSPKPFSGQIQEFKYPKQVIRTAAEKLDNVSTNPMTKKNVLIFLPELLEFLDPVFPHQNIFFRFLQCHLIPVAIALLPKRWGVQRFFR